MQKYTNILLIFLCITAILTAGCTSSTSTAYGASSINPANRVYDCSCYASNTHPNDSQYHYPRINS